MSTDVNKAITLDTLVGDVLKRYPQSAGVFTRFGIDTCCGLGRPLAEGARVARVDAERLLIELAQVAG